MSQSSQDEYAFESGSSQDKFVFESESSQAIVVLGTGSIIKKFSNKLLEMMSVSLHQLNIVYYKTFEYEEFVELLRNARKSIADSRRVSQSSIDQIMYKSEFNLYLMGHDDITTHPTLHLDINPAKRSRLDEKCLICQDTFGYVKLVENAECGHGFHEECLLEHVNNCLTQVPISFQCPHNGCACMLGFCELNAISRSISGQWDEVDKALIKTKLLYLANFKSTQPRANRQESSQIAFCPRCEQSSIFFFEMPRSILARTFYCDKCEEDFCVKCRMPGGHGMASCAFAGETVEKFRNSELSVLHQMPANLREQAIIGVIQKRLEPYEQYGRVIHLIHIQNSRDARGYDDLEYKQIMQTVQVRMDEIWSEFSDFVDIPNPATEAYNKLSQNIGGDAERLKMVEPLRPPGFHEFMQNTTGDDVNCLEMAIPMRLPINFPPLIDFEGVGDMERARSARMVEHASRNEYVATALDSDDTKQMEMMRAHSARVVEHASRDEDVVAAFDLEDVKQMEIMHAHSARLIDRAVRRDVRIMDRAIRKDARIKDRAIRKDARSAQMVEHASRNEHAVADFNVGGAEHMDTKRAHSARMDRTRVAQIWNCVIQREHAVFNPPPRIPEPAWMPSRFTVASTNVNDTRPIESDDEVDSSTKRCPFQGCSAVIEKNGGCDHMHCLQCGGHFCWKCLKKMERTRFCPCSSSSARYEESISMGKRTVPGFCEAGRADLVSVRRPRSPVRLALSLDRFLLILYSASMELHRTPDWQHIVLYKLRNFFAWVELSRHSNVLQRANDGLERSLNEFYESLRFLQTTTRDEALFVDMLLKMLAIRKSVAENLDYDCDGREI